MLLARSRQLHLEHQDGGGQGHCSRDAERQLPSVKPSAWTVDSAAGVSEENGVTTGWFAFETDAARGYGLVRLKDGKIWTLLTTAAELKGHEEPLGFQRPLGAKHGAASIG